MNTTTINISLPTEMYKDAKLHVKRRGYASVSELIRDAVREWLYPRITINGFTPEFEAQVLKAEKEPRENHIILESKKDIRAYFENPAKYKKMRHES